MSTISQNSDITLSDNLKQLVADMAICASNVQIATQAVVKLAGNIGGIYSIVNAADYGTQIYKQVEQTRQIINKIAYAAEKLSAISMNASAQVSSIEQPPYVNNEAYDTLYKKVINVNVITIQLAEKMKKVIGKIQIFAGAYHIFNNAIIKKKALNSLISDDLLSVVSTTLKDLDSAVALIVTANKSAITVQADVKKATALICTIC